MDTYTIKFANVKTGIEPYTHYVGRKNATYCLEESILSNPYPIKRESEREEFIELYKGWLEDELKDPMSDVSQEIYSLSDYLLEHKEITLGCWCSPKKCHAEVIAEYIYTATREKYLVSKIGSNGAEPTINVEIPQRGTKRASRRKEPPTQAELTAEFNPASALECTKCTLCSNRTNSVWIRGEGKKGLLIVGEAPGETEDKYALPFIGKSGKMLEVALNSVGLESQRDCWIVNAVKCRPPENRNPTAAEIKKCLPYLISQIAELKPKVILAVGSFSAGLLTGVTKFKPTIHRGVVYQFELSKYVKLDEAYTIPVVPTFHPDYLLRNPGKTVASPKYYVWKDLILVSQLLG